MVRHVNVRYNILMATIVDIDDTLLRNGDQPIQRVIDYVNSLPGKIIIVTGRNVSQRKETVAALRRAGVKYSRLIMNPGSSADTAKYKYEVGMRLRNQVDLAIDNNATMRDAYRRAGIKTKDPASLPDMKKFWF
jgi:ABC-type nitrate/sulfonate/bicarbonate transport system substrate-binding protein